MLDAAFIAAARTALPACLDEIERLRRVVAAADPPSHVDAQIEFLRNVEIAKLRAALTEALEHWKNDTSTSELRRVELWKLVTP